jgi:tripartite-type tricarboxylate transporter receptor subunit TctC
MKSLSSIARVLACLLLAFAATMAHAQSFPTKPVRMIVPYAPGGVPDALARLLSVRLAESLGQQFIVENRPSAGGIVAAEIVARSPADGHVILLSDIQQLAINPYMFAKLPYDPVKDFIPVTLAGTVPLYIVAQPSLNVNSLQELIALAKSKPGMLTYGSSGIGSIHHIAMEAFKAAAGVDIVHIPYKGAGQSVPAFVSGDTSLVISAYPAVEPFIRSGKAKLIAITTAQRASQSPNVAPVAEVVPNYDFSSEMGFSVPSGTPPAVVATLSSEIAKALKNPGTVQRLNAMGAIAIGSTPQDYSENIRQNLVKFEKAVRVSGVKPE